MYLQSVKYNIDRVRAKGEIQRLEWVYSGETIIPNESWYFETTISSEGFRPLDLPSTARENIIQTLEDEKYELATKLMNIVPDFSMTKSLLSSVDIKITGPEGVFIHDEEPFSIILRTNLDSFVIVTNNKEDCENILNNFSSAFSELSKITINFGYKLNNFYIGKEFIKYWIKLNPYINKIMEKKPINDFERIVINLMKKFSGSFISNLDVIYREPKENYEYDLIYLFSNNIVFLIEVTDYQKIQEEIERLKKETTKFKENLKSTIILRTIDKSIRLFPNINVVVILKGFPKNIFSQVLKIAKSRGIILLNERDLETKVKALLSYSISYIARKQLQDFYEYFKEYKKYLKAIRKVMKNRH